MNKATLALTGKLSGGSNNSNHTEYSHGFVETFARAYETARNALEYRAENLVRRAAIERILKRLMLIYKDSDEVAENLLTELKWARYLDKDQIVQSKRTELVKILDKYLNYKGEIPNFWITKIASAEIEELFNLNKDYNVFTFFAFQALKQKIKIKEDNLDLLIYFAVDKIYAASDPEQIAFHIISLAGSDIDNQKMEEGWKLFNQASENKNLPRVSKFIRRQMPPLVLLRDIYFSSPSDFKVLLDNKDNFLKRASEVLDNQLKQMSGKISTAGVRSILYVFLTKMVIAFGVETPLETFIYGQISLIPLIINLVFPPLLMWVSTMQIKIPTQQERDTLTQRTLYIVENFDELTNEEDSLDNQTINTNPGIAYWIFSVLYAAIFMGIFVLIYYVLGLIGYKFFSKFIFVFFLTIIAFFAYRIKQISNVYLWKPKENSSSMSDMISLPILTIGSLLSQGLTKINFLGFLFDFILEAPIKLILGFLDDWVQFLSFKKEQQILD